MDIPSFYVIFVTVDSKFHENLFKDIDDLKGFTFSCQNMLVKCTQWILNKETTVFVDSFALSKVPKKKALGR